MQAAGRNSEHKLHRNMKGAVQPLADVKPVGLSSPVRQQIKYAHAPGTTMSKRALTLALVLLLFSCSASAKDKKTPAASAAELSAITARGRELFEYERAVWRASQALSSLHISPDASAKYIAQQTGSGWLVVIGSLSQFKDTFDVAYEFVETNAADNISVRRLQPPRQDRAFFQFSATAIDTAVADFRGEQRPYNAAPLPADSGQFYVYVYPAVTKAGVLPLGGDVRYLMSADGKTVVEKRQLHKTILDTTTAGPGRTVGGFHTHVLTDLPEDTDVVHAMLRGMPEYIGSLGHTYQVAPDGKITVTK